MVALNGIRQPESVCCAGPVLDAAVVLAAVTDIVREVCDDPTIKLTSETETDAIPAWQELTYAGVAVEAECRFDVRFQPQEVSALRTIGDLMALIARKRGVLYA
jgi:acyl carrier protein